jgi:peroxiredoxin
MADETLSGTVTVDTAARQHEVGRRRWLPYLTLIVLGQVALLLHLLPDDPVVREQTARLMAPIYRFQQARERAALLRNDPRPGVSLLGAGSPAVLMSALRRGKPAIVVFTGICSGCNAQVLEHWQRIAAKPGGLPVVVISRDTPHDIARFRREQGLTLPMVPDPNGWTASQFNAVWMPRAYLVSVDGRLLWIQKRITQSPAAIEQDVRAAGGASG